MEFDIKYEKVLQEIDKIIYTDYTPRSLKNFIEGYRLDENLREKQDRQLKEGLGVKRKQYVDWSEIKHHERQYTKAKIHKIAQNEIERIKSKEREKEYISKIDELGVNKKRFGSYDNKDSNKTNQKNIKIKEFSKLVNRMNLNKIQNQKKNNSKTLSQSTPNSNPNTNSRNLQSGSYSKQYLKKKKNLSPIKVAMTIPNESTSSKTINVIKKKKLPSISQNIEISNNRYNIDKRSPLDIKPDYLHESISMGKKKNGYDIKKYSNKNEFIRNLDDLKYQAQKYAIKAKEQEQLMKIQGQDYNTEACEKMSNYLCDSIQAKIAILKQINQ